MIISSLDVRWSEAGITSKYLTGHPKVSGHNPYSVLTESTETDHAWNAVYVANEWRLIDCTWDSGHVKKHRGFEKGDGEFYFLTDPDTFINDHFPYFDNNMVTSQKWQLLHSPMTIDDFHRRVQKEKTFYLYDASLESHVNSVIRIRKEAVVVIGENSRAFKSVHAKLKTEDEVYYNQYVFIEKKQSKINITVKPPVPDTYMLQIYGSVESGSMPLLLTYFIDCTENDKNVQPLPHHKGLWGFVDNCDDFGFAAACTNITKFEASEDEIAKGEMKIKFPTLNKIEFLTELHTANEQEMENCILSEAHKSFITCRIRLEKSGLYKMKLFAKRLHESGEHNKRVGTILLVCKTTMKQLGCFPEQYTFSLKTMTSLIEPTKGQLPGATEVCFCLYSPLLRRVKISDGSVFYRGDDDKFCCQYKTPTKGTVSVFGSDIPFGKWKGLYEFTIE